MVFYGVISNLTSHLKLVTALRTRRLKRVCVLWVLLAPSQDRPGGNFMPGSPTSYVSNCLNYSVPQGPCQFSILLSWSGRHVLSTLIADAVTSVSVFSFPPTARIFAGKIEERPATSWLTVHLVFLTLDSQIDISLWLHISLVSSRFSTSGEILSGSCRLASRLIIVPAQKETPGTLLKLVDMGSNEGNRGMGNP